MVGICKKLLVFETNIHHTVAKQCSVHTTLNGALNDTVGC